MKNIHNDAQLSVFLTVYLKHFELFTMIAHVLTIEKQNKIFLLAFAAKMS